MKQVSEESMFSRLPGELMSLLGPGRICGFFRGGSGSVTFRYLSERGDHFVKFIPDRLNCVDGHGPEALQAKAAQVQLIHASAPRLSPAVPFVKVVRLRDGSALLSPFVSGHSPYRQLVCGQLDDFAETMRRLLDLLGLEGYGLRSSPISDPHLIYSRRVDLRLQYLTALWSEVGESEFGYLSSSGLNDIRELTREVGDQRQLLPEKGFFPVHGDLNLLNVLSQPKGRGVFLVDQRGIIDDWDPVYDLGKMLLTICIQGPLESYPNEFRAEIRRGVPFVVVKRRLSSMDWHERGVQELRRAICEWSFRRSIDEDCYRLWLKILYAMATHALSEAGNRISVSMSPVCSSPHEELVKALVYLGFGTGLMNELKNESHPTRYVHFMEAGSLAY